MHIYEIYSRKDKCGVDPISDALPFGRLWYTEISQAIDYAQFYSRSNYDVMCLCDKMVDVIEALRSPPSCTFRRCSFVATFSLLREI